MVTWNGKFGIWSVGPVIVDDSSCGHFEIGERIAKWMVGEIVDFINERIVDFPWSVFGPGKLGFVGKSWIKTLLKKCII